MIEARLPETGTVPPAMLAMSVAVGQLALLRMWIAGEGSCSSDALARQMTAFSDLIARWNVR
jgi:hypothetical protein